MRALVLLVVLGGCRQLLGLEPPTVADAGPCPELGATCIGDTLRECSVRGEQPIDTVCGWGCSDLSPGSQTPHCQKLNPSGGVVSTSETDPAVGLVDVTFDATVVIDTDLGSITGIRQAGTGVVSGIEFTDNVLGNAGVFRMRSLTANMALSVTGTRALVIIATEGAIEIGGIVDLRGSCMANAPGPGGSRGGNPNGSGQGTGAGLVGQTIVYDGGGGGGGYGVAGGRGGDGGAAAGGVGGQAFGDDAITTLVGGSGGGGGGDGGPSGGGGGGAIQLVSNARVEIRSGGGINAGGCGGNGGNDGGGGGGAGGTILIEAPIVAIDGQLAVNGGGGGGGLSGSGADGRIDALPASGGMGGAKGGDGGSSAMLTGAPGGNAGSADGGGAGGAVGRIRVHTRSGTVQIGAMGASSPAFDSPGTTATQGIADVN